MPTLINGQTYYRTTEVCQETEISRATLYRWLRTGLLAKSYKDRRGWRLFTGDDVGKIRAKANMIEVVYISLGGRNDTD